MDAQYVLFSVLGLPVTAYALCLIASLGMGIGVFLTLAKKEHLTADTAWHAVLLALPLGLLGARVFYCLARYKVYNEIGLENVWTLWNGGYALWGAVGGAALAGVIAAKWGRRPVSRVLDAMAPAGALVISLMRFAEYFSGEGIGPAVAVPAFQRFPFAMYDDWYGEWYWAVFMLEGLAALTIFLVLLRCRRPAGDRARLFLICYSACQMILESLRRDSFLRWLFVRVSQLTAILVIAGLMIAAVVKWARNKHNPRITRGKMLLCWAAVLLGAGVIVAMEFAVDGKILAAWPNWLDYLVIALCCCGIGYAASRVVLSNPKEND